MELFCFDDYKYYQVNLRCYFKEEKQNKNLIKCKGDFSNIEQRDKCKIIFMRYNTLTIDAHVEFPILE